jgi:alanine racemase
MVRRPCWVEISTGAFEENYRVLAEACGGNAGPSTALRAVQDDKLTKEDSHAKGAAIASPVELLAIVKADAYGHGLVLCAPAAVRAGARWLGVTSVEEGVAVREATRELAPAAGILAIGGMFDGQAEAAVAHRITPVVWEPWQMRMIEEAAHAAGCDFESFPVHLELDTGMSRQGVGQGVQKVEGLSSWCLPGIGLHLRLDGLMTHLYAADERDAVATREQLARLESMVERVFAAGLRPRWLHVGNSAAVLLGDAPGSAMAELRRIAARFGMRPMARPGLALYGLAPEFVPDEPGPVAELRGRLRRVLEWKTRVVSVRDVDAGQVIGYNGTFVATEPMRLALLAVGYADGLRRALSNRGSALVRGQRAPVVGRISMDQTVVDVTEIPGVAPGDEVVLLGRQGAESITAEDHAAWAGTIPWEIFTSITSRVERVKAGGYKYEPSIQL